MDKLILRDDHDLFQIANISTEDQRKAMRLASDPLRLATSDQYVPRLEVEKKSVKTKLKQTFTLRPMGQLRLDRWKQPSRQTMVLLSITRGHQDLGHIFPLPT